MPRNDDDIRDALKSLILRAKDPETSPQSPPGPELPVHQGQVATKSRPSAAIVERLVREKPEKKVAISIRLDADVVGALRATGRGWQTRVNALLRDHLDRKSGSLTADLADDP